MGTLRGVISKRRYYFVFSFVVVSMLATTVVPARCPVCNGVGVLSYTFGMECVRVVSVDSRIWNTTQDACTSYIVVKAAPVLMISNTSLDPSYGYLRLRLVDLADNQEVCALHLYIEVPANATSEIEAKVVFAYISPNFPPDRMAIMADVMRDDNVPCIACNGVCKVSLSTFPLTLAYKNTLVYIVRNSSEYGPEEDGVWVGGEWLVVGSDAWLSWMELQ